MTTEAAKTDREWQLATALVLCIRALERVKPQVQGVLPQQDVEWALRQGHEAIAVQQAALSPKEETGGAKTSA